MIPESENYQGFYQQLFELSADAHLIIKNSLFVDCNQATVKMLGYVNKQEFLKTHPSELSPPLQSDGRNSVEKADEMMAIAREQGSHRFYWDHQKANGEVFPVEVLLTMLVSAEGQEVLHTVWRDITQRRERELALKASEAKFRSYLEYAPLGIFISSRDGRFIDVNPEAAQLTGVSVEMLKQGQVTELFQEQNMKVIKAHLKNVSQQGRAHEDLVYVDNQGKRHDWSVSTVRHGSDRFLSFVVDMTDRRRVAQLHTSLKDLANSVLASLTPIEMARITAGYIRDYFRSDAIGIWYNDEEAGVTRSLYIEDTPLEGTTPEEYPAEDFLLGADYASGEEHRTAAYLKNRTAAELERAQGVLLTGNQSRMSASIISAPILWENAKIGVITVHSYKPNFYNDEQLADLQLFSTLIGTAVQRAFAYERLNESIAEKEILLQELQHRTRNNMNVINSLLNMQSHESRNEHLIAEFRTIEERIFAMSTAYSKLQQGHSLNIINLRSYLLTLAKSLYHAAPFTVHDVKLVINLDEIFISLEQAVPLGLIFNEMMSNACKHAFPQGRQGSIRIALKNRADNQVWLSVSDDGVGLSPDNQPQSGRGLGLRIIEMLVKDQLSGQHTLQTRPGCVHQVVFTVSDLRKDLLKIQ